MALHLALHQNLPQLLLLILAELEPGSAMEVKETEAVEYAVEWAGVVGLVVE